MDLLSNELEIIDVRKQEYNNVPVWYCRNCLSLKINGELEDSSYCEECNSADIELCSIEEWEKLFESRYGYNYLKGKKSKVYNF